MESFNRRRNRTCSVYNYSSNQSIKIINNIKRKMRRRRNTPLTFVITFCVLVFVILCAQAIGLYFFAHGNVFTKKNIEFEKKYSREYVSRRQTHRNEQLPFLVIVHMAPGTEMLLMLVSDLRGTSLIAASVVIIQEQSPPQ